MNKMIINPSIDLKELCSWWDDNGEEFKIIDSFGEEFVTINKETREVYNYGYNGMLSEWYNARILIEDNNLDTTLCFPHTIGRITFYTRQELESWVLSKQM